MSHYCSKILMSHSDEQKVLTILRQFISEGAAGKKAQLVSFLHLSFVCLTAGNDGHSSFLVASYVCTNM